MSVSHLKAIKRCLLFSNKCSNKFVKRPNSLEALKSQDIR